MEHLYVEAHISFFQKCFLPAMVCPLTDHYFTCYCSLSGDRPRGTRIENISEKKLIGMHLRMNLANNKTGELWRSFMPFHREITNPVSNDLFSMQVFDEAYNYTDPFAEFEKWATAEVTDFEHLPSGMETFILPGGLYAVFLHKGAAATAAKTFQFIFGSWLPDSDYLLDNRPHFELIGERYKNDSPDSEEEIWIPVKRK